MKKTLLLMFCFLSVALVNAQSIENQDGFQASKQFGVIASTISGTGIFYIAPINEKDNFKIAGIYIYDSDDSYTDSFFSLGAEYQRDFYETRMRRIFFLAGTSIDNSITNDTFFYDFDYEDESNTSSFNLGVGVGADLGDREKGLIINFHVTYQLTQGFKDSDRTRVGLGGGIGLGFNF